MIDLFSRALGPLVSATVVCCTLLGGAAQAGEVRYTTEGHAYNPVWSPDGKRVAFEVNTYSGGGISLWYSDVTGEIAKDALQMKIPSTSGAFQTTNQVVTNPTWHPEGMMLFEGANQGGAVRIYFGQPGGSAAVEMLSSIKAPGDLGFPTVSADGKLLFFISDQTGAGDIRSWDRSTDKIGQITNTPATEVYPQLSPDAKKLSYTRKVKGSEDMFEIDIATSAERPVAGGNGDQTRPAYADGGLIVYFSGERGDGHWDLIAADSSGTTKTLAQDVRLPLRARPALSPDRKWVAYAFDDPQKANSIYLQRVDGSSTVEVPTDFVGCGEPAIGKQGTRIMLAFTALPDSGADWRFLFVRDVTDQMM